MFTNPQFTSLQPMTTDESGWIRGHLIPYGEWRTVDHDYSLFHSGTIAGVPVGHVVISPFARLPLGHTDAREFYDRLGRVVADAAVGDDEFGIWYSGQLRPDAPDVSDLNMASDFRVVNGKLALVQLVLVAAQHQGGR